MNRFFVTGGSGFIGQHLVKRLLEAGGVTVYDRSDKAREKLIDLNNNQNRMRFIKADLGDFERLTDTLAGHDIVFHLAANADIKAGTSDTSLDLRMGTFATYNVLEAMRNTGVKKIVFASTSTVYGETGTISIAEDHGPLLPISLYGASKLAGEALVSSFCHLFGMQSWIYRFANVVGPGLTHGVIYDFIRKLRANPVELEVLGDGSQQKPYLYVDDCIEGILFGLEHSNDQVNVFNLGNTSSTCVTSIADMVAQMMGLIDVRYNYTGGSRGWPGDVPQVRYDTTKMRQLGWEPCLNSDEAVLRTIQTEIAG